MLSIKKKDGFKDERHIIVSDTYSEQLNQLPLTQGTTIKEMGYYPKAKYHYRERYHDLTDFILIFCLDGEGVVSLNGSGTYQLKRGDVFCIPKNMGHYYYSSETNPWSILWVHFDTKVPETFQLERRLLTQISSPEKNHWIQDDFIKLFDISEKSNDFETALCAVQLLNTLLVEIIFLKDELQQDKQNLYLAKSIKFLNKNLSKTLTLQEMANHLNISQSYLSSIYKKYLHKSPIEYFNEIKIEQACKYLKMSDLKIYEIGNQLGFTDPYYFSRAFKKNMHLSPKEYRQKYRSSL